MLVCVGGCVYIYIYIYIGTAIDSFSTISKSDLPDRIK